MIECADRTIRSSCQQGQDNMAQPELIHLCNSSSTLSGISYELRGLISLLSALQTLLSRYEGATSSYGSRMTIPLNFSMEKQGSSIGLTQKTGVSKSRWTIELSLYPPLYRSIPPTTVRSFTTIPGRRLSWDMRLPLTRPRVRSSPQWSTVCSRGRHDY